MATYKYKLRLLLTHLIIMIVVLIAIFPIIWIVINSFKTRAQVFTMPPVWLFQPTLINYQEVLFQSTFPHRLLNSIIITISSVSLALLLGVPAGYAFDRFEISHKEDMYFFIFTIRMGPAVAFAIPFYLLFFQMGLLDTHIALILIYQTFNLPFAIWMMRGFFEEVPKDIEEAALLDGCSKLEAFLKVILPNVRHGLAATAVLCAIFSWNEFFMASILTRAVASTAPVQMPAYIGLTRIRWEEMCAASSLMLIPIIIFAAIVRRYLVRGLTLGMIK